jgi:hypothetical protein
MNTYLNTLDLSYIRNSYRFSFSSGNKTSDSLEESILKPDIDTANSFNSLSLDRLNEALVDVEELDDRSSVVLGYDGNPLEIKEILAKVSGRKYETFIKQNAEGFVFGRNFERLSDGVFREDLGAIANEEASLELTEGDMGKLIFVDTYNSAFNSVEAETENDEMFTHYSQILSVLSTELRQSYDMNQGVIRPDNPDSYSFVRDAFVDIKSYLDEGKSLSFLEDSDRGVFGVAIDMMVSNLDEYIAGKESSPDRVVVQFTA